MFRKHLCWLLGHITVMIQWPYSGPYAKIFVPYCKHCNKCLTTLPWEMLVTKHFHEEYKTLSSIYPELYKK